MSSAPEPTGSRGSAREIVSLLGLPFDVVDRAAAVSAVRDAVRSRRRLFVSTPNLNFVVGARQDSAFRRSVQDSDLSLADGMPIVWIARLLGLPIRERVAGSDVFEALQRSADRPPIKVFFFGGEQGAGAAAELAMNSRAGGLECVGHLYPGFGSIDEMSRPEVIAAINRAAADFVVVALGARKGQAWIQRNRSSLEAPVISHLGAVINFQAGRVQRAPAWVARLGAEWLWRIAQEPALLKRYAVDGAAFLRLVVTEVLPLLVGASRRDAEIAGPELFDVRAATSDGLAVSGVLSRGLQERFDTAVIACGGTGALRHLDASAVRGVDAWGAAELAVWLARRSRDGAAPLSITPSAAMRRDLRRLGCEELLDFR